MQALGRSFPLPPTTRLASALKSHYGTKSRTESPTRGKHVKWQPSQCSPGRSSQTKGLARGLAASRSEADADEDEAEEETYLGKDATLSK